MSQRGDDWKKFAEGVAFHIEMYTVPQYGDKGNDQVTEYTAADCIKQAQKYLSRFGKNSREGQQELDFLKVCHYVQMAADKYVEEQEATDATR